MSLPGSWKDIEIGELALLINGRGFKPHEWKDAGLPIIRIQNLNGSSDFNFYDGEYNPKIEVETGQLLFAWSGSRGTSFGPHIWSGPKGLLNYHTWKVVPDESKVDKKYFLYLLRNITSKIESEAHGASALVHTQKWKMEQYEVSIPPLPEQMKIAEILSTWDALISNLGKLIKSKKKKKNWIMSQLLPGKNRFKEFEDQEWQDKTVDKLGIKIIDGDRGKNYPKSFDFSKEGYCLFLSAKNVTKDGFKFTDMQFISEEKDNILSKGKLTRGDIILTTRGTVGNIAHYDDSIRFENVRINSGMVILRNENNKVDSKYLYNLLDSYLVDRQIDMLAFGSAQPQLTVKIVKSLIIPAPSYEEQIRISHVVNSIKSEIKILTSLLEKTVNQKRGVMQQLLTGKTRVKV